MRVLIDYFIVVSLSSLGRYIGFTELTDDSA